MQNAKEWSQFRGNYVGYYYSHGDYFKLKKKNIKLEFKRLKEHRNEKESLGQMKIIEESPSGFI